MTVLSLLSRVAGWLRAGYPEGIPPQDYIPLIALLGFHLSEEETVVVARELMDKTPEDDSTQQIRAMIRSTTDTPPSKSDVKRIRDLLTDTGWDLPPANGDS